MKKRIVSAILLLAICFSAMSGLIACGKEKENETNKKDALVIMTENLDGLFNPFFSTSANDGTIVSMTQIGMLSSKLNEKGEVDVAFGQNEATATLDFESVTNADATETVYTFVLKNGIKYSDGHPLTMEDVLFNLYVYLDPVYSGSATIYSTDIKGLAAYRYQQPGLNPGDSGNEDEINVLSAQYAQNRIMSLVQLYTNTNKAINGQGATTYYVTYENMVKAIKEYNIQSDIGYLNAVAPAEEQGNVTYMSLLEDYELALKYFREELESDFKNAKDSYTEEPYKSHPEFQDEVFCFMFTEGFITPKYDETSGKPDKSKIVGFEYNYNNNAITTKDAAIEKVYGDTVATGLNQILTLWATSTKLTTEFTAKAKEVLLQSQKEDGQLIVPNIEGIVSLGHTTGTTSVTVNGNTYAVAQEHNADGTPKNANEYDVLQITINGVDPKAVWNFAFSVAPQHYYGEGSPVGMDIANNQFGVSWSDFDYMRDILQTNRNNKLPMGAGAYKVTNRNNDDNPGVSEFFSNNIVYFKANNNFETVGTGLNNAKIGKVRYQVVSASNALAALQEGSVDYITPQYSRDNYAKINELTKGNYEALLTDQLGYGYIGINASKVTDINLRRAIMAAMNTTLAIDYYAAGTASQICWPMSKVSWAYPFIEGTKESEPNGKQYPQMGKFNEEEAIEAIRNYMALAGVTDASKDSRLKLKFTIAGSNLQDHPSYKVFRDAADLLNSLGWDITVEPDTQALTKLATGFLTVWAAAWGSSLDPDMYQVYHKNSTATSTLAWGYNYLKITNDPVEKQILDDLSLKIEEARETEDKEIRSELYMQAMSYVLDLAIELPVYQRSTVYVYNTNVIDPASVPDQSQINPYSSPLDRIWELEFAK